MAQENVALLAFNRGLISKLALARIDLKKTSLSAEVQTNWMPRELGSMMLRPGLEWKGSTKQNKRSYNLPFVFSNSDKALIEFTDLSMRVRLSGTPISRGAVSTVVTSGDFSSDTGWTDDDEAGGASTITGGKLELVGTRFAAAARKQEVTVSGGDANKEHALRIVVDRGPVRLRVGTGDGLDDYISETDLGTGTHSLAFTPTGNFWIQFSSLPQSKKIVDSCTVEASGVLEIDTPYLEADLRLVRYDQSADVVYLACKGYQQRKIERRGTRSWSIVKYEPQDGPFRNINISTTTFTPSGLTGDITLTASRKFFKSSHVGALFKITSIGQKVVLDANGSDQFTDAIRVVGIDDSRKFTISRLGTWSGTLTLQRSVAEPGSWVDVTTYTDAISTEYDDGLDNQIVYYRIGFKTGAYVSGTANLELSYASGGLSGVAKVTGYTNETTVSAAVLSPLGGTTASSDWYEGEWSDRRGYPSAIVLHEGRLWQAGKVKVIGSVSDAYESFDDEIEGDSRPINRSIGSGPVDNINWLLSLSRLLIGTDGREWSARSSSLDEPLTVENFNLKSPSTQGSFQVGAEKLDDTGLFVQKSGKKLFKMSANAQESAYGFGDFSSLDLCALFPELGQSGILRIQVQRQPDTRIHCLLGNGDVGILLSNPVEEVLCWVVFETQGNVEDIVILPGEQEDEVYYQVARTINGSTVRGLEKWALETECQGDLINKQADSFVVHQGASTNMISGLDHLEGETVVCWADGRDLGMFVVSGGKITLNANVSNAVAGLKYEAFFRSTKLAYAAQGGTALNMKKIIQTLGVILSNTHYQGLKYGTDFERLDDLPLVEGEAITPPDTVWESLDTDVFTFPGQYDTDTRLCLYACAPKPCTVLAAVMGMKTNE